MRELLGTILLASFACSGPSASIEGKIAAVSGEVMVLEDGEKRPATVGDELRRGLALLTGAASRVSVTLQGGHAVELEENSVLAIRPPENPGAVIGAKLERGNIRVTSPQTTIILEIGTPFGLTELGSKETRAELDSEQGMTVEIGEVVVHPTAGDTVVVSEGKQLSIAGIVLDRKTQEAKKETPPRVEKKRKKKKNGRKRRTATSTAPDPSEKSVGTSSMDGIRTLVLQGELAAAEAALHVHLKKSPKDSQAWMLLGDTERKMRKWKDAISAYGKATNHGSPMLANRARFLAGTTTQDQLRDHSEAARLFSAYLTQSKSVRPLEASARFRLANSLLALGKRDAAENQLRKVVSDHPKSAEAQRARSLLGQ